MSFLLLVWKHRKVFAALALFAAIVLALAGYGAQQYKAGAQAVQTKWAADTAARDAAVAKQLAELEATARATRARNEAILDAYTSKLDTITADRDSLARRMHDYQVRERALSSAADQRGAVAGAEEPSGPREVDAAFDAYDNACRRDAAQLEALIRQIQRQLDTSATAG